MNIIGSLVDISLADYVHGILTELVGERTILYYVFFLLLTAVVYYFASHGYVWYKVLLSVVTWFAGFNIIVLVLGLMNVPKFATYVIAFWAASFLSYFLYEYLEKINAFLMFFLVWLLFFLLLTAVFRAKSGVVGWIAAIGALIIALLLAKLIAKYTKGFIIFMMGILLGKIAGEMIGSMLDFPKILSVITEIIVSFHAIFHQIRIYGFIVKREERGEFDYKAAYEKLRSISDDGPIVYSSKSEPGSTAEFKAEPDDTASKESYTIYYSNDPVYDWVRKRYDRSLAKKIYANNKKSILFIVGGMLAVCLLIGGIGRLVSCEGEQKKSKDDNDRYYEDNDEDYDDSYKKTKKKDKERLSEDVVLDLKSKLSSKHVDEISVLEEYADSTNEKILSYKYVGSGRNRTFYAVLGPYEPDYDWGNDYWTDSYCRVVNIDGDDIVELENIELVVEARTETGEEYTCNYRYAYDDVLTFDEEEIYCVCLDDELQHKYYKGKTVYDPEVYIEQNEWGDYAYSYYENDDGTKCFEAVEVIFDEGKFKQYHSKTIDEKRLRREFSNYDEILEECQSKISDLSVEENYFINGYIDDISLVDVKKSSNGRFFFSFSYKVKSYDEVSENIGYRYYTYVADGDRLIPYGYGFNSALKGETSHLKLPIYKE